jgi:hypothetical protein
LVWNDFLEDDEVQTLTKPTCPRCNSKNQVKILYGLIRFEKCDEAKIKKDRDNGKIVMGGCSRNVDSPIWSCKDCHHRWGNEKEEFLKWLNRNG